MPFRKTEMASSGVKLETASITSASVVKSLLNPTRKIKTIALKIILMKMLFAFTIITDNFVTLGWPAPNSLLTRTLQFIQHKKKKNQLFVRFQISQSNSL